MKEIRRLQQGDKVITGRTEDGSEGIYVYPFGFTESEEVVETFAFRTGRTRETSYSRDYDKLYDLLKYEKDNGHIVWVLGPAVTFDHDSKSAMMNLIHNGYVHAVLGGNALATHDLEGSLLRTALGQDIYTPGISAERTLPSLGYYQQSPTDRLFGKNWLKIKHIKDGIVDTCIRERIPLVLTGSIRDDGPSPGVIADVYTPRMLCESSCVKPQR
jgi:hypothetical protein